MLNEMKNLKQTVSSPENTVLVLQEENRGHKITISNLENENRNLKNRLSNLEDEIQESNELNEVDIDYLEDKTTALHAVAVKLMISSFEGDSRFLQYANLVQDILQPDNDTKIG
ncbi:hypothetical protein C9374_007134 [Naegleria lovaniensis]|uniref:Uncharacterized protein n=1 Tax=Naegleria lovaniensis TaxID=51637 RepID=A0AA88GYY2_NAELO|nr:uncharacterized protein C9374_007134 [Naegleria lovaniensis]KAG2393603.1 hypothetical protein C9374_007134 [Naegleria lovaniensis]